MKKRTILYTLTIIGIYILLLIILTEAERALPGATIRTFGDSLWFSIVTMTTVGFGDMYPVSFVGRGIGYVFMLVSVGILAAVIYAVGNLIRTRLMPAIRMQLTHGNNCFIFSELNETTVALARDLMKHDPKGKPLFCGVYKNDPRIAQVPGKRLLFLQQDVATTVRASIGKNRQYSGKLLVFLMFEDTARNYACAKELEKLPVRVFCRGAEIPSPEHIRFFNEAECCARQYWQRYPIRKEDRIVLVIGRGVKAAAIVNQAVLMNCRVPFDVRTYHLFGDWENYCRFHPSLNRAFSINETKEGTDSIFFHKDSWNEDRNLLENADRIIFCDNNKEENVKNAALIRKYFAVHANFHIAMANAYSGIKTFAEIDQIYTEELVVKSALDARAKALHEAYCRSAGGDPQPWDRLPLFLKDSNRAAADALLCRLRILLAEDPPDEVNEENCRKAYERWKDTPDKEPFRRNEHERWLRFHCLYNWRYGPEKDSARRTHPCLTEYDALSKEEQAKDDAAWEQIGKLF